MKLGINYATNIVICLVDVNRSFKNMGKTIASLSVNQYINGLIAYIVSTKPIATLATEDHGVASGLPRYELIVDRSK
jgi:hypothetical protein